MSRYFNDWRQAHIKNLIKVSIIVLKEDHDDLNLHFTYKGVEVKAILNSPYPYPNPEKTINQVLTEYDDYETVKEDFFREIFIYMNIKDMLDEVGALDDEDEEEEDILDSLLDDDEDYEDSYEDKLKKHFPGLYLSDWHIKGYDQANSKKELLHDIMMEEVNSIFAFSSIRGLVIENNYVKFSAPYLSMAPEEWMFYACTIIDKINKYFKDQSEDEDDNEDSLDEEWSN